MDVFDRDLFKAIIDEKLKEMATRKLVAGTEVQDILLDLRNTVLTTELAADPTPDFSPLSR